MKKLFGVMSVTKKIHLLQEMNELCLVKRLRNDYLCDLGLELNTG